MKTILKELRAGDLLVASPNMDDEYFKDTVILVAALDEVAVAGFILNRPTTMPASELFDDLNDYYRNLKRKIFVGGPVEEGSLHLVARSNFGGSEICPGLRMGGRWSTVEEMLLSDEYENRLFLGYCGWDTFQLQNEIKNGDWLIFRSDAINEVFNQIDNQNMATSQSAIAILNEFAGI